MISATYYAALASTTGLDTSSADVRGAFQPLNPPPAGVSADQAAAANEASIGAYHVAMLLCAALLVVGAVVSWYGLRERRASTAVATPAAPATPASDAAPDAASDAA